MKVVVNRCFGGFGLSVLAEKMICERKGVKPVWRILWGDRDGIDLDYEAALKEAPSTIYCNSDVITLIDRDDEDLVAVVEELGDKANGGAADLEVVEIPDGIEWEIDEYDGIERVDEKHRSW